MQLSEKIMKTLLERYPLMANSKNYNQKWSYDFGVVLQGVKELYYKTDTQEYFDYIKENMDLIKDKLILDTKNICDFEEVYKL